MSGAWKQRERLVAAWWSTKRNPLSGRNNYADSGEKRIGDIITPHGVVEVKRRKSVSMREALETRRQAPGQWAHYEFKTGCADMVKIACDHATGAAISAFLRERWAALASLPTVQAPVPLHKPLLPPSRRPVVRKVLGGGNSEAT